MIVTLCLVQMFHFNALNNKIAVCVIRLQRLIEGIKPNLFQLSLGDQTVISQIECLFQHIHFSTRQSKGQFSNENDTAEMIR